MPAQLEWQTMTDAVNKIKPVPRMLQDLVFTRRNTNPTKSIEVDLIVGGETLAPLVQDMEGARIVEGTSREQRVINSARIRIKYPMDANTLLTTRTPGAQPYIPGGGNIETAYLEQVGREQKHLRNKVDRRIEEMCAQALTGAITIEQENISFNVDYLMPAEHKVTLAGDDRWSEATADVRANLKTAARLIKRATGFPANLVICGTDAAAALLNRVADDSWFNTDAPRLDPLGGFRWSASEAYLGRAGGLSFYEYVDQYATDAGVMTDLIAPDKVYVIATAARISLEFGLILDIRAKANVQAEYFSKQWEEEDPSNLWNLIESRPLPVLWQPEAIVEIDVL